MLKPEDFTVDTVYPLDPKKIVYISASSGLLNNVYVFDMTDQIKHRFDTLSEQFIDEAKTLTEGLPPSDAVFALKRVHWYSTHTAVVDAEQSPIAEIKAPLTSLGSRKFVFPKDSPHSSHEIEMKPVGIMRRAEGFVKDSVQYFWELEKEKQHSRHRVLHKVSSGTKKVEIGRYAMKHGYDHGGVLVLDSTELDELVGVMSCVAFLNQRDSFAK